MDDLGMRSPIDLDKRRRQRALVAPFALVDRFPRNPSRTSTCPTPSMTLLASWRSPCVTPLSRMARWISQPAARRRGPGRLAQREYQQQKKSAPCGLGCGLGVCVAVGISDGVGWCAGSQYVSIKAGCRPAPGGPSCSSSPPPEANIHVRMFGTLDENVACYVVKHHAGDRALPAPRDESKLPPIRRDSNHVHVPAQAVHLTTAASRCPRMRAS